MSTPLDRERYRLDELIVELADHLDALVVRELLAQDKAAVLTATLNDVRAELERDAGEPSLPPAEEA